MREYRRKNPGPGKLYGTPEERAAWRRIYRAKNKEKLMQKRRDKYRSDPERWKVLTREWQRKNPEKWKAAQEKYIRENPDAAKRRVRNSRARKYGEFGESYHLILKLKEELGIKSGPKEKKRDEDKEKKHEEDKNKKKSASSPKTHRGES